jgi:hypothetical protein
MKRLAPLLLLIAFAVSSLPNAWSMPQPQRENRSIGENAHEAKKAAKQQKKINKKIAKKQAKDMKKYQKSQRKAEKQQRRRK